MENNKKKIAIYIGRFAPLHNGHIEVINYCNNNYDETIVLIGSKNKRRTIKNPFPVDLISNWILNSAKNTIVRSINDYLYSDNKWIAQVEDLIYSIYNKNECEFTIVGHEKDSSSFYLKIFPTWRIDLVPEFANGINATDIRETIFSGKIFGMDLLDFLSKNTNNFVSLDILKFMETKDFEDLLEEKKYFENEDKKFANYPYKDTLKFNCSDAVVVCDGNILLIQRDRAPGKNIWALPGGFVTKNETYEQCAIRELFEETCLKVPEKVIKGSLKRSKIFDNPNRNIGIPRITNAFYFEIQPDYKNGFPKLPKIKGADDARNAKWVSLAEVRHMILFDDHSDIIDYFVNSI